MALTQPVLGNGLTFATSGSGKYRNEIAWFSWTNAGTTIGNNHQVRGTFDVGGESVTAACTISDITSLKSGGSASLKSYKPGTWEADGLPFLYGIDGTAGANKLVNGIVVGASGQQVGFKVSCSATRGQGASAQPFPLAGLVLADAETASAAAPTEAVGVTLAAGAKFYLLEAFRGEGCTTDYGWKNTGGNTPTYEFGYLSGPTNCRPSENRKGHPTFVGYVDQTTVNFKVHGQGLQAIAIGVLMPVSDFGDAPSGYGSAGYVAKRVMRGTPLAGGTTATSIFGANVTNVEVPLIALGKSVTYEPNSPAGSRDANEDQDDAFADLVATTGTGLLPVAGEPGSTYSVTGTCIGEGKRIDAWFDLNRDGAFDDAEHVEAVCLGGSFTVGGWQIPVISAEMADVSYLRLRISDQTTKQSPTGTVWDAVGEVEDWVVPYPQNDNDMVPVLTSQVSEILPDDSTHRLTLSCTNAGPGRAVNPDCDITANIGTIQSVSCTPAAAPGEDLVLQKDEALICEVAYRLPTAEARDRGLSEVTFTATTGAQNESQPGLANNTTTLKLPLQKPELTLQKALAPFVVGDESLYRDSDSDQFRLSVTGEGVNLNLVTTGSGAVIATAPLSSRVAPDRAYRLAENVMGGANAANYTSSLACRDEEGTLLLQNDGVTEGEVTPLYGQKVDCVITNTYAPTADLVTVKTIEGKAAPVVLADNEVVTYKITVENKGPATARAITLTDSLPSELTPAGGNGAVTHGSYDAANGGLWSIPELAPGARATLTLRGTVPADLGGETIVNTTTAAKSALIPDPSDEGDILTVTAEVEETPGVRLVKTARLIDRDGNGQIDVGDQIAYSFEVFNTGNSTLVALEVTDPKLDSPPPELRIAELAPGASVTLPAEGAPEALYTLTAADLDAGVFSNLATVTAHSREETPGTPGPVTDISGTGQDNDSPTETTIPRRPGLRLVKSAELIDLDEPKNGLEAGDVVEYRFTLHNIGNQTLTDLVLSDAMLSSGAIALYADPDNPASGGLSLAAGASVTVPRSAGEAQRLRHSLTQAEFNAGSLTNTATATGTTPTGGKVSDVSGTTVDDNLPTETSLPQNPAFTLTKTAELPRVAANPAHVTQPGDPVAFTFTVTNTGNQTLTGLQVEDPMFSPQLVGVISSLQPGESRDLTAELPLTLAQIDAGEIVNTARLSGTRPGGGTMPPVEAEVTVPVPQSPKLALEKTAVSPLTVQEVGEVVTFDLKVTNTGNASIIGALTVEDETATSVSCPALPMGRLAPGASISCTATQTVTLKDLDSKSLVNTARVTGTSSNGTPAEPGEGTAIVPVIRNPSLSLEKVAGWTSDFFFAPGTRVPYRFTVTNTGNVTLYGALSISDRLIPDAVCPVIGAGGFAPGASLVCEGSYVLTIGDVAIGSVTNNATAHFEDPTTGEQVTSTPDTDTIPPGAQPALSLVKELIGGDRFEAVGDRLVWRFTVTNTGNVSFTRDVVIHDPLLGGDLVCHDSRNGTVSLDPLAHAPLKSRAVCEAVYLVTQEDLDRGHIHNVAHAASVYAPLGSSPVVVESPVAEEEATGVQRGAISLSKRALTEAGKAAGERLEWEIIATNTGNVTLENARIFDPQLSGLTCAPAAPSRLAPGATLSCTGAQILSQSDLDQGEVSNSATTSATTPSGGKVDGIATATYRPAQPVPGLALVKTASYTDTNSNGYADFGDHILFVLTVTNTGNVTLGELTLRDDKLTPAVIAQNVTLAPGQSRAYSRLMPLTQAMIDAPIPAGSGGLQVFENSATASAKTPSGQGITDLSGPDPQSDAPTVETFDPKPKLVLLKEIVGVSDINANGVTDAGDLIEYRLTLSNRGGATLSNILVDDPLLGGQLATIARLAPGETLVLQAGSYPQLRYRVTQENADAGGVTNRATAMANPLNGQDPVRAEDEVTEEILGRSGIALVKRAALPDAADGTNAGDRVVYSLTVTNTGTQSLSDIAVSDPMLSDTPIVVPGKLEPGASVEVQVPAPYRLTQADIDKGRVENQASVSGRTPGGDVVTDLSGSTTSNDTPTVTPLTQAPGLSLVKTGVWTDAGSLSAAAEPGETITYSFVLKNTGNVTLTGLELSDPLLSEGPIALSGVSLAPGQSLSLPGDMPALAPRLSYVLTQDDINRGEVRNSATATGQTPTGGTTSDVSGGTEGDNTPTVTALPKVPGLAIVKTFNPVPDLSDVTAGFEVTYNFSVTNTGNVPLEGLRIEDPKLTSAPILSVTRLEPGAAAVSVDAVYRITQADIDAGVLSNTATASGRDATSGTPVTSPPSVVSEPITPQPAIGLVKEALAPLSYSKPGEVLKFRLTVTNEGNVTFANGVQITEGLSGAVLSCTPEALAAAKLAPGESLSCDVSYTTVQADVDAGEVLNTATATATVPGPNGPVTATDDGRATVPAIRSPGLALNKRSTWDGGYEPRSDDDTTPARAGQAFTEGTRYSYLFHVVNTGNTVLEGPLVITDPMLPTIGGCHMLAPGKTLPETAYDWTFDKAALIEAGTPSFTSGAAITLAPGRELVCEVPYVLSAADTLNRLQLTNTATASIGSQTTPPSSVTVPADLQAELHLEKRLIAGNRFSAPGDTLTWEFVITNTGLRDLSPEVTVLDALLDDSAAGGVSNGVLSCRATGAVLAPVSVRPEEATVICTAVSTVTQEDLERGFVQNTAIAKAGYAGGLTIESPPATAKAEGVLTPAFTLRKSVALAPATPGAAPQPVSNVQPGTALLYTITLQNTGNTRLYGVKVSDPMLRDLTCDTPVAAVPEAGAGLEPGAVLTCTGTHVVTQAQFDSGALKNLAQAEAITASGTPVGPQFADVTVEMAPQKAGLTLLKEVQSGLPADRPAKAGDRITYLLTLTYQGNVSLSGVTLRDPLLTPALIAENLSLTPRIGANGQVIPQVLTWQRDYVVTQEDIDSRPAIVNQAFVTGRSPAGPLDELPSQPTPLDYGTTDVPLNRAPVVELEKTLTGVTLSGDTARPGDMATFAILVRNGGNVTLSNLKVSDPLLNWEQTIATLAPGASESFTAELTLTQAHIDAKRIVNTAIVTGDAANGEKVNDADEAEVTFTQRPALSLVKTAVVKDLNGNGYMDQADEIEYSFEVRNTGNVTLTNITVTDPLFVQAKVGEIARLAPGDAPVVLGPVRYKPTAEMLSSGRVENTARAQGRSPDGGSVSALSGTANEPGTPTISELNRRPVAKDDLLDNLTTGQPVVVQVMRNDSDPDSDAARRLLPDSVQLLDPQGGEVASLSVPGQGVWSVEPGGSSVRFIPESGFTSDPTPVSYVVKDAAGAVSDPAKIELKFTPVPPVANDDSYHAMTTGEKVSVPVLTGSGSAPDSDADGSLDTASLRIEGADASGLLVVPGQGTWATEACGTTVCVTFTPLRDSTGKLLFTGNPTPVSYRVSDNDGNVSNPALVTVTYEPAPPVARDDLDIRGEVTRPVTVDVLGKEGDAGRDSDPDGWLLPESVAITGGSNFGRTLVVPGEGTWTVDPGTGAITFTPEPGYYGSPSEITYTVRDNDNNLSNPARVTLDYSSPPVISLTTEVVKIDDHDGNGLTGEGDEVHYRFTVTNDGLVPVENVTLPELTSPANGPMLSGMVCTPVTLLPGQSAVLSCTGASHRITKADVEQGEVQLDARASAKAVFGPETALSAVSSTVTRLDHSEGILIEKTAALGTVRSGQLLPYSILVKNASPHLTVRVDVRDRLPAGMIYRKETARIGTLKQEPERNGQTLWFRDIELAPGAQVTIELQVLVSGSIQPGPQVNRAQSFSAVTGRPNSREATATVLVDADPVFDCGTVIGTVFNDYNLDGYQNPGEPGIPGARLVTVRGTIITTDQHGRYHVPCADLPRDIGSNYVLKLDDRSLPTGFRITTENPGDVRLTAGKMVELNFGASLARLVRLDIDARAFVTENGEERLNPALEQSLKAMADQIRNTPSVLRVVYLQQTERERLMKSRLKLIEQELRRVWRGSGRYGLLLETMIQASGGKRTE